MVFDLNVSSERSLAPNHTPNTASEHIQIILDPSQLSQNHNSRLNHPTPQVSSNFSVLQVASSQAQFFDMYLWPYHSHAILRKNL